VGSMVKTPSSIALPERLPFLGLEGLDWVRPKAVTLRLYRPAR
jgi:hypothetical protein